MSIQDELLTATLAAGNKHSTYEDYWEYVEQFIRFTRTRHHQPVSRDDTSMDDVYAFRDHLASMLHWSPSTCNKATTAVKFLFQKVIEKPWDEKDNNPVRLKQTKKARRRVIARPDLLRFFDSLNAHDRLIAQLMYAGVMRLSDVIRLRLKDLNFDDEQIELSETKHDHFRIVPFPRSIHDDVLRQVESVRVIHKYDAGDNPNGVPIDHSYGRKCPSAPRDLRWYWLFPSDKLSRSPIDGRLKRNHRDMQHIRNRFRDAIRKAGILRRMTAHDLRRVSATHLHLSGKPLTELQLILGHNSIEQTRDYIMDGESQISGADSPFDALMATRPKPR